MLPHPEIELVLHNPAHIFLYDRFGPKDMIRREILRTRQLLMCILNQ